MFKSEINIGIICPGDFRKRITVGGAIGFVENILDNLEMSATIFGYSVNNTPCDELLFINKMVKFIAIGRINHSSLIPARFLFLIHCIMHRKYILKSGCDMLYIHSPEVVLPFIFFNKKIPVIYHQHGSANPLSKSKFLWARNSLLQKLFDLILKIVHRRADWMIAIDRICFEQARLNGASKKTSLMMNAVDIEKFCISNDYRMKMRSYYCLDLEQIAVLFVGRIEEIKRVDIIIDAFEFLKNEGMKFRLFLAGDGTLRKQFEEYASRKGLQLIVTFLGNISHEELPLYYNMADVVVLPSDMEGVPMALLEAMACGTPVIASSVGGIPGIVNNGKSGILLENVTSKSLAIAISKINEISFKRNIVAESVSHLGTKDFLKNLYIIIEKVIKNKIGENPTRDSRNAH
jgi:glycosyltransferase involved in cell wall biosynthesis